MNYHQYRRLHDILLTDFSKSEILNILDMAMQLDDLEQALLDFCENNDIETGE